MGLKRKASFEESSMSSTSPQSLPPSSQSSSADTATSVDQPLNLWNIAGAPYFNSRTRKRFRDDRPDEETIHQNTLSRLFNAQRQQKDAVTQEPNRSMDETSPQTAHNPHEQMLGPSNQIEVPRDRSQRSLDGFFNTLRDRRSESLPTEYTMQEPLPASLYQPQENVPHLIPPHPAPVPSILTCEDCDEPLLTKTSGKAVDTEMLDVDGSAFMDSEIAEGWSCSVCAKRVCDVCAVRGNYRVCLECAAPGEVKYKPEEIQEKRWVGGIGWM